MDWLRVQFPIELINPVFKTMIRTTKIEGITRNKKKERKKEIDSTKMSKKLLTHKVSKKFLTIAIFFLLHLFVFSLVPNSGFLL